LPTERPIASSASAITMTNVQAIDTRVDIDSRTGFSLHRA
jgi:hypothetical protein